MISCSSSTASSTPATSRNVILGESAERRLARDLPKHITREPPPWTWLIRKNQKPRIRTSGSRYVSSDGQMLVLLDSMLNLVRRRLFRDRRSARRGLVDVADFIFFLVVQFDGDRIVFDLQLGRLDFVASGCFR